MVSGVLRDLTSELGLLVSGSHNSVGAGPELARGTLEPRKSRNRYEELRKERKNCE